MVGIKMSTFGICASGQRQQATDLLESARNFMVLPMLREACYFRFYKL